MNEYKLYTNINKINRKKWKVFYKNHYQNNAYQTFEMYEFWSKLKDAESFIFLLESVNEECLAFCTGAIVHKGSGRTKFQSKSALIFGGPLIDKYSNKKEILEYLLHEIERCLKFKSKNIEFRNFKLDKDFKEVFSNKKWKYTPKVNYIVGLTNKEDVFQKFSKGKRSQIRKALREGVVIEYAKSRKNAEGIYDILKEIYLKNFDDFLLPLPDFDFLLNLLKMKESGLTTVRYKDKIIGGEFFLMDSKTIYGWFGGGLNIEYKKVSPMSISNWATMKYGIDHNIRFFDYGGAGVKGKENRLRTFKSAFGGELIENGMFSKINLPLVYKIENKTFKIINKIFNNFN